MGGDNAPAATVEGAAAAARELGVEVALVGSPDALEPLLASRPGLTVIAASEVVEMDEHPARAVRRKRDSSMAVCARTVREGAAAAWVSAGNSGAVLATAILVQGRIRGVERPALGSIVPTSSGSAYFLDVGANTDCRPEWLEQFAIMGAVYAELVLGFPNPKIALLSNGEEPGKGNQLVQAAYERIHATKLNFVGNVEGKDVFAGKADVVVADGFYGNIAIKMAEAVAEFLFRTMREEVPRTLAGKLGGLLIRSRIQGIRDRVDWREFGGAPLLGIDGVAVVAHGRSDARAIRNAIRVAKEAAEVDLTGRIRAAVAA